MFECTQRLVRVEGKSYWAIGHETFRANDREACAAHNVPAILDDADQAVRILASWIDIGMTDDMIPDYAADIASEAPGVLEALVVLAHPANRLEALIEAAKDLINARHIEATEDYGYMDAKNEAWLARRG
jgi:hypothetical protein